MKIESPMDAVAENFLIKLLGISWLHELDGGIYNQVNSCIAMLATSVAGISL